MPPLSTPSFNSLYTEDAGTKYGALAGLVLGLLPRLLGLGKDKNTNSTAPTAVTAAPVADTNLGDFSNRSMTTADSQMQQPQVQPTQTQMSAATPPAQQGGLEKLLASLSGNGGGLGGLGGTGGMSGMGGGLGGGGATNLPGGATGPNGQPFQAPAPVPVSYAGTGYQGGAQAFNPAAALTNGPGGYPLGPAVNNPFLAALLRQQQRPMG